MIGAIIGDMAGSPYEFRFDKKTISYIRGGDMPLFAGTSTFTDDTVMTLAVARGLMRGYGDEERSLREVRSSMISLGRRYPCAGYGGRFIRWLLEDDHSPYGSFGNGSAMRVSPAAWLYDDMDSVLRYARITALPTHDHEEGIKGACATAAAVYMARKKYDKDSIASYIEEEFGYDLSPSIEDLFSEDRNTVICQRTVPEALICFLKSSSFEDAVRKAVSLGGDTDTTAAIAGSIAEGYYGIPLWMEDEARFLLPEDLLAVLDEAEGRMG